MQSEYTELKSLLHEDQTPYSDMFELRTWGATRKTLSLKVIVEGIPKCNEHLFVVSHDRQVGRVDNFIKNEDENVRLKAFKNFYSYFEQSPAISIIYHIVPFINRQQKLR